MKREILSIFALANAIISLAQATQPCIVKQYNQKLPKTPLAGVEVVIRDAGTNISNENGTLTLNFNTQKPGDKVVYREISKPGYMLFNTDALNQWFITRNGLPFEIVMVKSEYFEQLKGKLYKVSKDSYETKYQKALGELKLEKERNKMKEDEYQKKILELEDKHYEDLKNLNNYIEQFARIDLSEVSEDEQYILELVEEGRTEEAIQSYDKLELNKKLSDETSDYLELGRVVKSMEGLRTQKKENIDSLYASINRYVSTMMLADKYKEATEVLALAVSDFSKLFTEDPETNRPQFANLQLRLGEILVEHQWRGEKEASIHLISALSNYMILYKNHPDLFFASVANTKILLGKCKLYELDYIEAESLFLDALTIWKQRTERDCLQYYRELASTEHLLGKLYAQWISKCDKAENFYLAALDHYAILVLKEPKTIHSVLADLKSEIGIYYDKRMDFEKAESYYIDAQKEYASLADRNSDYLVALEEAQKNIADFYRKLWKITKKEEYFTNAEANYKAACRTALAQIENEYRFRYSYLNWSSLSELYIDRNEFQKAEACISEYNIVYKKRYPNDDNGFNLSSKKGDLYLNEGQPEMALQYFQDAIEQSRPYEGNTAWVYMDIALCYQLLGDSTKMEESMDTAFNLLDTEDKKDDNAYNLSIIELAKDIFIFHKNVVMLSYQQEITDLNMSDFDLRFQERYAQLLMRNHSHNYKEIAHAQKELGKSFEEIGNPNKAEHYYIASLENFEQLKKEQQEAFSLYADMAETQSNLAMLYYHTLDNAKKAEEYFLQSLTHYILAEEYNRHDTCSTIPQLTDSYDAFIYKADISFNQRQLGYLYFYKKEFEKTDSFLHQAYDNYILYYKKHPNKEFTWNNQATIAEISYFETFTQLYMSQLEKYDNWLTSTTDYYEKLYEVFPENKTYKARLMELLYRQARRDAEQSKADKSYNLLNRCQEMGDISVSKLSAGYNAVAYAYAREKAYKKALETIDKAISLQPEVANYYDSKGEILLMKGDEKGALEMWQKVIEQNPQFVQEMGQLSNLYKQLKERGLI